MIDADKLKAEINGIIKAITKAMISEGPVYETTCRFCKHRYDDAHLYFPDCWLGHRDENKKEGRDCPYYKIDDEFKKFLVGK